MTHALTMIYTSPPMLDQLPAWPVPDSPDQWPDVDLRQMLRLTDDTGILQHALHAVPDPNHGYCIDDNARALLAALLHVRLSGPDQTAGVLHRYLQFVSYAFNPQAGRFRNFMGYDRRWLEQIGSEDSHGRTLWVLGEAVRMAPQAGIRDLAEHLLLQALPACSQLHHLRPWAFALLGLDAFLAVQPDHAEAIHWRAHLAQRLFAAWDRHAGDDWPWWEDILTWGNARLPHAQLITATALGDQGMADAALRALAWLLKVQTHPMGHLTIVGNDGWMVRGQGNAARYDQQPLEAYNLIHACLTAHRLTNDSRWLQQAWRCFGWFVGHNDLGQSLISPETGGCRDGLGPGGVNINQGAESTLAYVLSVLELRLHAQH